MADDDGFVAASAEDLDILFLLISAMVVFFMQVGFSLLEIGSVQPKNTRNVLTKNIFDASVGAIWFCLTGYGVAFGKDYNGVIGTDLYFLQKDKGDMTGYEWAHFLFQWAFVATSATILSGAVADRIRLKAYMIFASYLSAFAYPMMVHWVWHGDGWLSAFRAEDRFMGCGVVDFAGSGVVHTTGGIAALVACWMIGPRHGVKFKDGKKYAPDAQSSVYQTTGCLVLWFGWFAFNGGSVLYISAASAVAARAMVFTALGAAIGGIATAIIVYAYEKQVIIGEALNGILAGLVSITAGCATMDLAGIIITSAIGGGVYFYANAWLAKNHLDDVVAAFPVHGACGIWGVIAAGLFSTPKYFKQAYNPDLVDKCSGLFYGGEGNQFLANFLFILICVSWSAANSAMVFWIMKKYRMFRVPALTEKAGVDLFLHNDNTGEEDNMDEDIAPSTEEEAEEHARMSATASGLEMLLSATQPFHGPEATDGDQLQAVSLDP